jgi:hypothetical protein
MSVAMIGWLFIFSRKSVCTVLAGSVSGDDAEVESSASPCVHDCPGRLLIDGQGSAREQLPMDLLLRAYVQAVDGFDFF